MGWESDRVAKCAAEYVSRGLRVVRLYGVRESGVCMCWKGRECGSPGKHTTGEAWEVAEAEDRAFDLFEGSARYNVGIILGPADDDSMVSVIDVECDDDEAEAVLKRMGLDRVQTPIWSSGRGFHRLFLWHPSLPSKAMVKRNGIEFRIGGGGKLAQSVAPPSVHHSGSGYQWRPGFSLDDVEIAPLPDALRELLCSEAGPAEGSVANATPSRKIAKILRGPVREGERNDALFRGACLLARSVTPTNDDDERCLLEVLRALNTSRCVPPLAETEVVDVFRNALKYRRKATASECLLPGVEVEIDGARTIFRPAGWELTIRQGDPTMYELRCAELAAINGTGIVSVPAETWMDPRKMRDALAAEFPGLCIDRYPGDFARLWSGEPPRAGSKNGTGREACPGLRVRLERDAVDNGRRGVETDPAKHRLRQLVGMLVTRLDRIVGAFHCDHDREDATDEDRFAELLESGSKVGKINGRVTSRGSRCGDLSPRLSDSIEVNPRGYLAPCRRSSGGRSNLSAFRHGTLGGRSEASPRRSLNGSAPTPPVRRLCHPCHLLRLRERNTFPLDLEKGWQG